MAPRGISLAAGVPAQIQGGTPLPLPAEQTADALETIEFGAGARAGRRARGGPAGRRARPRAGGPRTISSGSGRSLQRVGEVAALFRRGDALLAEPIPDVTRALGTAPDRGQRARRRGAVAASTGSWWPRGSSRPTFARVAELAPLAGALARPLPDKAHRAAAGAVGGSGRQPARHRESAAGRRPARGAGRPPAPAPPAGGAASRAGRRLSAGGRIRHDARRPLRHSGAAGFAQPARRASSTTRSGSAGTLFIEPSEAIELGNALREAQVEEERETLRVLRELTDLLRPAAARCSGTWSRCASRWTISSPGRGTPSTVEARCPRSPRRPPLSGS